MFDILRLIKKPRNPENTKRGNRSSLNSPTVAPSQVTLIKSKMLKSFVSTFHTVIRSPSVLSEQQAVEVLNQWQTTKQKAVIFDSDRREITQFLEAMDIIQLSPNAKKHESLISKSMERLINEFRVVLSRQSSRINLQQPTVPSTTTATTTTDYWSSTVTDSTGYTIRFEDFKASERLGDDVVAYLRTVAGKLSLSGKIEDCARVYKSVREPFLRSQLRLVRFDEVAVGDKLVGRSNWDELIVRIKVWTEVSKICVKTLFVIEKEICEQVFRGLNGEDGAEDKCFVVAVQNIAINLFALVESISSSNLSYDKIGDVLGLYDGFVSILPDVEALFASYSGKKIRDKCEEISTKIRNDVVRLLYDFEKEVLVDTLPLPDQSGSIHKTTIFVGKKIGEIAKYKELLSSLINSTPELKFNDSTVNPQEIVHDYAYLSFLEQHLILIIECLKINMSKKIMSCPNTSLAQLFLMNNVRYIVQKIESSRELQEMIGDSYKKVLNENIKSAMDSYQESTCKRFLTCFEDKGPSITRWFRHLISSRTVLRRRLKTFNNAFEEVRSLQSSWKITDPQIRNQIRVSMSNRLVPAYKNFLAKFTSNDKMKRLLKEKKIEHSAEDFEALILRDLFAKSEVDAS